MRQHNPAAYVLNKTVNKHRSPAGSANVSTTKSDSLDPLAEPVTVHLYCAVFLFLFLRVNNFFIFECLNCVRWLLLRQIHRRDTILLQLSRPPRAWGKLPRPWKHRKFSRRNRQDLAFMPLDGGGCGGEANCQLCSLTVSLFISGGIKAPAGHEEEEAGDVKDTDRMSEGDAAPNHTPPPVSHYILSSSYSFPARL